MLVRQCEADAEAARLYEQLTDVAWESQVVGDLVDVQPDPTPPVRRQVAACLQRLPYLVEDYRPEQRAALRTKLSLGEVHEHDPAVADEVRQREARLHLTEHRAKVRANGEGAQLVQ